MKSKVLAKLFLSNGRFYLYDTNKNEILEISKEVYTDVQKYIKDGDAVSDNIVSLVSKGYLSTSTIERLEHPYLGFANAITNRNVRSLILQVTKNCNFRCRYCSFAFNSSSSRHHSNDIMSWEIAKKSIDYLIEHSVDSFEVNISFYGGEPLLCYPLIKECVAYVKDKFVHKQFKFSMTTNFYSVTSDMANFLAANRFDILISLDGPEKIHNRHRRLASNGQGTFDRVIQNIEMLKNIDIEYFNNHVGFNPVVLSDESPNEIYDFFEKNLNVRKDMIQMHRVDHSGLEISYDSLQTSNVTDPELNTRSYSYYLDVLTDTSPITKQYHLNGSCVAGGDKLFISTDGSFYPCEKANECNECMRIGSLYTGIEHNKVIDLMNICKINEEECSNCWAIRFCKMCCINCDDGTSGLSAEMKEIICRFIKNDVMQFFDKYIQDQNSSQIG